MDELTVETKTSLFSGLTLYRVQGDMGCWYPSPEQARECYAKVQKQFAKEVTKK